VLFVGIQQGRDGLPSLWAEIDDAVEVVELRNFECIATGDTFPDDYKYIGTFIAADGFHVWHVCEK
jgi:hypothetical protein